MLKSNFEYIERLTGIDVFDKEAIDQYIARLNEDTVAMQTEQVNLRKK